MKGHNPAGGGGPFDSGARCGAEATPVRTKTVGQNVVVRDVAHRGRSWEETGFRLKGRVWEVAVGPSPVVSGLVGSSQPLSGRLPLFSGRFLFIFGPRVITSAPLWPFQPFPRPRAAVLCLVLPHACGCCGPPAHRPVDRPRQQTRPIRTNPREGPDPGTGPQKGLSFRWLWWACLLRRPSTGSPHATGTPFGTFCTRMPPPPSPLGNSAGRLGIVPHPGPDPT